MRTKTIVNFRFKPSHPQEMAAVGFQIPDLEMVWEPSVMTGEKI
jgi:hypothetical protein